MTLTQMRYFQAVCRYENYTRAAQALFVSQPTVSQALKDLEQECGEPLFARRGNTLQVTQAGRLLLAEVEIILRHHERIQEMVAAGKLQRDYVRVGISTFSASSVFPQICAAFHRDCPGIRILSHEDSTPELMRMLDEERADLVITSPTLPADELAERYGFLPLTVSGLRYCVAAGHPFAGRERVSLEEMAAEPLVLLDEHYTASRRQMELFQEHGLTPNVLLRTSQMFTVERFVVSGAAAGFLPAELAAQHPGITAVPFAQENTLRPTLLLWRKGEQKYSAAESFIRTARAWKEQEQKA